MKRIFICFLFILSVGKHYSQVWQSDLGDGNYKNPVLYADYSDPDVVKVGDDFFMTASSFNCVPALPILHSNDLVNWEIVNYAIKEFKDPDFDKPQHGNGVWAPSIRFHDGYFYIYYGDPDRGIYMVKTNDPYGDWESPVLVKKAYGNIDPCPLWDDDNKVYLVHAFAHSRAGVKSLLQINELNSEGTKIIDKGYIVFDGHDNYPTIEGPKFYKRNGYYYIFAPAGGVATGWQTILRSKNIYGPYEDIIVLHQGNTEINGPHQGGLVELESGESWFIHFQDKDAYGRIVHLQPVEWIDDWPLIGKDINNDGIGEPVEANKKPKVGKIYPVIVPATSDEFNSGKLGLQWQWHANPKKEWYSFNNKKGVLRLNSISIPENFSNFWDLPNLLLQKLPGPELKATVKLDFNSLEDNEQFGLIIMGTDYSYLGIKKSDDIFYLLQVICIDADKNGKENEVRKEIIQNNTMYLSVKVEETAIASFCYSIDGESFKSFGETFNIKPGKWIGAKVGVFCISEEFNENSGFVENDWFRIEL